MGDHAEANPDGPPRINSAADFSTENDDPKKFSDFIASPVVSIIVGSERPKTFFLHSSLVVKESRRIGKSVMGYFKEATERRIELPEEDPELFGYFVEYLYRDGWLFSEEENTNSDYITLARLYAMGDRLLAAGFQLAALQRFTRHFPDSRNPMDDQSIYTLLEIACDELPERIKEDPMHAQIFWYTASRLTTMQNYDGFKQLIRGRKDIAVDLCLRAGDSSLSQPKKPELPKDHIPARFEDESVYGS